MNTHQKFILFFRGKVKKQGNRRFIEIKKDYYNDFRIGDPVVVLKGENFNGKCHLKQRSGSIVRPRRRRRSIS